MIGVLNIINIRIERNIGRKICKEVVRVCVCVCVGVGVGVGVFSRLDQF